MNSFVGCIEIFLLILAIGLVVGLMAKCWQYIIGRGKVLPDEEIGQVSTISGNSAPSGEENENGTNCNGRNQRRRERGLTPPPRYDSFDYKINHEEPPPAYVDLVQERSATPNKY